MSPVIRTDYGAARVSIRGALPDGCLMLFSRVQGGESDILITSKESVHIAIVMRVPEVVCPLLPGTATVVFEKGPHIPL